MSPSSLRSVSVVLAVMAGISSSILPAAAGPTLVFDAGSGEILSHEAAFDRWYPASLTKLMTLYVTFQAVAAGELELTSPIRVSKRAAAEPPSKMGYKPGQEITLDNAIKILVVKSANDIATAVAENVGGSEAAFAERMNAAALRLGMTGSHFTNAHGLPSPEQYTTARDLALLARAIRTEFPQHAPYFAYEALSVGKKQMDTNVVLLGRFAGADGMKTGFICASGFNMVTSATREGRTLVAVVLGSTSPEVRAETTANLLEAGFAQTKVPASTLSTVQPYGTGNLVAVDLRDSICSKKAADERWAARGPEGQPIYRSPFITQMTRPPRVAAIGLGGATGPVPKAYAAVLALDYADVPIPTWRPDRPPPGAKAEVEPSRFLR